MPIAYISKLKHHKIVNWTGIGIGDQSTLGARHFCSKNCNNNFWKIKKMFEFHMPLALKIIEISECLCYLPDKVTILMNLTRFCLKIARILRNNCPQKNIFFTNFWGYAPPVSYAYADRQYKRHYAAPKRITWQAKVKQLSKLKKHIKSFFLDLRILYMFSHLHFADSAQVSYQVPPSDLNHSNLLSTHITNNIGWLSKYVRVY